MNAPKRHNLLLLILGFFRSWFRLRNDLAMENLALRQQLATFKYKRPRPRVSWYDRVFWVLTLQALEPMEKRACHRLARHRGSLASQRVSEAHRLSPRQFQRLHILAGL